MCACVCVIVRVCVPRCVAKSPEVTLCGWQGYKPSINHCSSTTVCVHVKKQREMQLGVPVVYQNSIALKGKRSKLSLHYNWRIDEDEFEL